MLGVLSACHLPILGPRRHAEQNESAGIDYRSACSLRRDEAEYPIASTVRMSGIFGF